MKKEDIKIEDIRRMLFGEAPPVFMLEVVLRTTVTFTALLLVLNLLGKRMTGQLSLTELAVMLTLGAIVSVPMQIPERGILQGIFILLLAVAFQRGLNYLAFKKKTVELATEGKVHTLVKDGVLQIEELRHTRLSREQVFATLRDKEINNLGEVKRLYLEACGMFNVYKYSGACEGLPIFPPQDAALAIADGINPSKQVCAYCGMSISQNITCCANCEKTDFIPSFKSVAHG